MLPNAYDVFEVPAEASDRNEPMGSRPKFWFARDQGRWLFKATRPIHGEDWAEVLAAEVADLIGLPHAGYQLAVCRGQRGVVTPSFQRPGFDLVHGNELLQRLDPSYPQDGMRYVRTPKHTISAVQRAFGSADVRVPPGWALPAGVATAAQVFAGYLLLDALIANTDRHHENWAVLLDRSDGSVHLAPTFDHAASLGAHERDETRSARLATPDPAYSVHGYVSKASARSALFAREEDLRPLPMLAAYRAWVRDQKDPWAARLGDVAAARLDAAVARVPPSAATGPARAFAAAILKANRQRILGGA